MESSGCSVHIKRSRLDCCWTNGHATGHVLAAGEVSQQLSKLQESDLARRAPKLQKESNPTQHTETELTSLTQVAQHGTKPCPRWINPTFQSSRTCQSGPNTPQGLR